MQVAFPTSLPTIPKVDVSSVYVGFDCLLRYEGFVQALLTKREHGANIAHFGGHVVGYEKMLEPDTTIGWYRRYLRGLKGQRIGILIYPEHPIKRIKTWYREYQKACEDPNVSVIAIAAASPGCDSSMDGILRVMFLNQLITEGRFCTEKVHWLYGIPNPAELAIYSTLFSNFVACRFELAICSTCFLYSIFGIQFSITTGIMQRLTELNDSRFADLGIDPWIKYRMSREQMRCFYLNVEIVRSFASGTVAEGYMDNVYGILMQKGKI